MLIDACYLLRKSDTSKTRYDVISSTSNYQPFEKLRRNEKLWFYLTSGDYTRERLQRKTKWKLNSREGHISKLFDIDDQFSLGDVKGQTDLLIFRFLRDRNEVQMFVSKGKKNDDHVFRCLISDRDPDFLEEMDRMADIAFGKGA